MTANRRIVLDMQKFAHVPQDIWDNKNNVLTNFFIDYLTISGIKVPSRIITEYIIQNYRVYIRLSINVDINSCQIYIEGRLKHLWYEIEHIHHIRIAALLMIDRPHHVIVEILCSGTDAIEISKKINGTLLYDDVTSHS